jgi:hypothetical protein
MNNVRKQGEQHNNQLPPPIPARNRNRSCNPAPTPNRTPFPARNLNLDDHGHAGGMDHPLSLPAPMRGGLGLRLR